MSDKKRSPMEIYNARAVQPGFCHLNDISESLQYMILSLEDMTFYAHNGVVTAAMWLSFRKSLRTGHLYGGSTITQQLVKNLYFTFEKSWVRKAREIVIARKFEKQLSKTQILELYLNIIYFDNGQYGISNASRFYFGKTPAELTFNQAIFLSVLLPVVGIYNPLYHPEEYSRYRDKKIHAVFRYNPLYESMRYELEKHGPGCLDEELCKASAETDKYNRPGPMINERFGPGMPESLICEH